MGMGMIQGTRGTARMPEDTADNVAAFIAGGTVITAADEVDHNMAFETFKSA